MLGTIVPALIDIIQLQVVFSKHVNLMIIFKLAFWPHQKYNAELKTKLEFKYTD